MSFQYDLNFMNDLIVDNFAGGGGASIGIELGTNRFVDIAINHDKTALEVHELNHPHAGHYPSDVFEIDPDSVCGGRKVGLAWFSPDCRHHSKAKGGKPVKRNIRGLAWVARKWARSKTARPRLICLENVEEFLDWGPLIPAVDKHGQLKKNDDGEIEMKPDPKRKGLTFQAFDAWFKRNGYQTDYKILRACDYGAPTIRRRFFWIARCDGLPIVWPEPTHAAPKSPLVKKKKLKPYRTAAECIDWSIPCPSIFMSKDEAREYTKESGVRLKRPLADATLNRVAKGVFKFVLNDPRPFIIPIAHYNGRNTAHPIDEPIRTITANPKGGTFAIAMPFLARQFGQGIGRRADEPAPTIMANGMGKTQLVNMAAIPMIARQFKTGVCHPVNQPTNTIMAGGGGGKNQLVTAFMAKNYTGVTGSKLSSPLGTITSVDHHSLVKVTMAQDDIEAGAERVAAFLLKYYGTNIGHSLKEPIHTITSKDRFSLVTVHIKGEPWVIVDIGIRMLQPHELMLAQGFPADYNLGNVSKTKKVALIGNSVPPPLVAAIVKANYTDMQFMKAVS